MASIQKRKAPSGEVSYRVQVRLKGHPEARATFKRLTDARMWAQSTEAAMRERRYFKTSVSQKHTVAEMIDRYIDKLKRERPKRYKDTATTLNWWKQNLGYCVLADLSRSVITDKIDLIAKRTVERIDKETGIKRPVPISASRVNRYIAVMSHVCTIATNEWEWLEDNPFRKIKKLQEPRGRVRFLSDEERNSLLKACKNAPYPHTYLIIVLAISTGMRKSEILNIRWRDVDLDKGKIILHETKNKERRVVPLTGHALSLVCEHRKIRRIDTDMLFPSQRGDKAYEIKRSWEGALKEAGIEDFRFHDLRHSAASYLAMNGASLAEIAEVLGHKTLAMVKRYAHLSDAHTSSVVNSMNEKVFGNV
ncbi:MAG: integrase [Alphaproteobacteria bacterium]|nr:integrase [Alphaproteobacteria bacterium]|tara:strand:+ start:212 stop:1303 length:1092 start_codon:yes stop_codon:yes gene_type:complete